jgi:glycosyltransferase involved in cell wall biosynthesis
MSYGLPVIANNIEGVVDYLLGHDNERGFVIQDNLLETWIDTITSIIDEKNYNENKAKQAYDWVVDNASFEAVEKKMGSLYTKLTNK